MQVSSKIFGIYLGTRTEIFLVPAPMEKPNMKLYENKLLYPVDDIDAFLADPSYIAILNEAFHTFLFKETKTLVTKSIHQAQRHFKIKPKKVVVERSIKKWGSCNQDRILTFNYLLATKPKVLIDYVVIHEMCHMLHLNHDRSFWRLLGSILPDYKTLDAKLNENH